MLQNEQFQNSYITMKLHGISNVITQETEDRI